MDPTSRTRFDLTIVSVEPHADARLDAEQFATAAGISAATLARLIRAGLVEAEVPGGDTFGASTVLRLRRMLRLHADLGVNLTGAAIIVEMMDRVDELERRMRGGA